MRRQCKGAGWLDWYQPKQNITGECDGMVFTGSGCGTWAIGVYRVVYLAEKRQERRSTQVASQLLEKLCKSPMPSCPPPIVVEGRLRRASRSTLNLLAFFIPGSPPSRG